MMMGGGNDNNNNNGRRGSFTADSFGLSGGAPRLDRHQHGAARILANRRGSIGGGAGKLGNKPAMEKKRPVRGKKAILLVPDSAVKYAAMFIIKFTSVQNRPILICHQRARDYEVIVAEIRRILEDDVGGTLFGYAGDNWMADHMMSNAVGSLTDPKFLGGKKVNLRESHGVSYECERKNWQLLV
jgi:hypothetical protein